MQNLALAPEKAIGSSPEGLRAEAVDLQKKLLRILQCSPHKLTPRDLEIKTVRRWGVEKRQVRAALHNLLVEGVLAYRYDFGRTLVELSFAKPVRISPRVILKPPELFGSAGMVEAVVSLRPGDAFGSGRHPSTRLALRALDCLLNRAGFNKSRATGRMLDVGTGSGVLSIAALQLGVATVDALDRDPVARHEARENVKGNGLARRCTIADRTLESIQDPYHVVTANLRYPTLHEICNDLARLTNPQGVLVLSGLRTAEALSLIRLYGQNAFALRWQADEKGWVGLGFRKLPDAASPSSAVGNS